MCDIRQGSSGGVEHASCASARAGSPPAARTGVIAVRTLADPAGTQSLTVGFNFSQPNRAHGFAAYDAALGEGGLPRVDATPSIELGAAFELRVFVDGHLVETFLDGQQVITSVTANRINSSALRSRFVNTAALECNVTSWVLGL